MTNIRWLTEAEQQEVRDLAQAGETWTFAVEHTLQIPTGSWCWNVFGKAIETGTWVNSQFIPLKEEI
jgi:hypothetical protein